MDSLLWTLRTRDGFTTAWLFGIYFILLFVLMNNDLIPLVALHLYKSVFGKKGFVSLSSNECPDGLIIIPSLLRNTDDFNAITTTIESCATNDYPSFLTIITSIDGKNDNVKLFNALNEWIDSRNYDRRIKVYSAGTDIRLGKMMAVEAGVQLMRVMVKAGMYKEFPSIYFSIDGDGTLSANALEMLVQKLLRPHPITKNKRRIVSGNVCIHPKLFWNSNDPISSLKQLFTIRGQIYSQVAKEFMFASVSRFNWRILPKIGIPGAIYCSWTDIILQAPRFMGYVNSITIWSWVKWLFGYAPPQFNSTDAKPCAEVLTGESDDTCVAFLASMSFWKAGKLSLEAPRTPLHALFRMFRAMTYERSHDYEPNAKVYTYTPTTFKGLWRQRVRWNSSQFECSLRFRKAFWFHWNVAAPTMGNLLILANNVFSILLFYLIAPYYLFSAQGLFASIMIGLSIQLFNSFVSYLFVLYLMGASWKKYLPTIFALPTAGIYHFIINICSCAYGLITDLLLFGKWTNFAPERTLKKGGSIRIALAFRARRFVSMATRSVLYGDVPFGSWWWGWGETKWTPSGYEGWTTNNKPRSMFKKDLTQHN